MRKLIVLLTLAAAVTGCMSVDIRRVRELEGEIARLEVQLAHAKEHGLDPGTIQMPDDLKWEINYLAVYPPYLETAIAIFPGILFPGLGAHAIGDPKTGWKRLGEAYGGVGELALGTGLTTISLAAIAGCSGDADGSACDAIFEMFATGVTYMVAGPVHYLDSWFADISSTYRARRSLVERVEVLKIRYARFMANYEAARRAYIARKTSSR